MNKSQASKTSFPFLSILCLIFITLKLTGHIAWSWWWVLSPFWLTISIVAVLAIIVTTIKVVAEK